MCSGVGIQALEKFNTPHHKTLISVTSLIIIVFSPDFVGNISIRNELISLTVDTNTEPVRIHLYPNLAFYKTTPDI